MFFAWAFVSGETGRCGHEEIMGFCLGHVQEV